MSEGVPKKCAYYNSGYCKFSRKQNGCRHFHPETNCVDKNCRDRSCPRRHPKNFKFGQTCSYQSRCSYKHTTSDHDNVSREIYEGKEQVKALKKEIIKLKEDNDTKVNQLVKLHMSELETMKVENAKLRKVIKESKESLGDTLASKDEEFKLILNSKDQEIAYYNSEMVMQRKNRWIARSQLAQIMTSNLNRSCHCCGKYFGSDSDIKEHNEKFRGYCFEDKVCFKATVSLMGWDLGEHKECPGVGYINKL